MSLPPLPEIFGNYALQDSALGDFVEISQAPAIDWWPQTPGWLVLGALFLTWALVTLWRALRRWHHNRYRREALRELASLATVEGPSLPPRSSELLKRVALAAFPRGEVAPLSGEAWVAFLNARCTAAPFQQDCARLLALDQYRGTAPAPAERAALLEACRTWITQHRGPGDA